MITSVDQLFVAPTETVCKCMAVLDKHGAVDSERRLLGTITDGDIRRAILAGLDLDSPAQELLDRRSSSGSPTHVSAPAGTPNGQLLELMDARTLRYIPLVDDDRSVADIALLKFKQSMATDRQSFHTGQRIHDPDRYYSLRGHWEKFSPELVPRYDERLLCYRYRH